MQTSPDRRSATPSLLMPPLSLNFGVYQFHKNRCRLQVSVYSGDHCFCRREIETFYDQFGELPVIVLDSAMRWILWLAQFEAERRLSHPQQRRQLRIPFPDWPAPDPLAGRHDEVGF